MLAVCQCLGVRWLFAVWVQCGPLCWDSLDALWVELCWWWWWRWMGWMYMIRWVRCRICVWWLASFSCVFEQGNNCHPVLERNSFHGFWPGVLKGVNIVTFAGFFFFDFGGSWNDDPSWHSGFKWARFLLYFLPFGPSMMYEHPCSKFSNTVPVNHFSFAPYCFCRKNLTCSFTFKLSHPWLGELGQSVLSACFVSLVDISGFSGCWQVCDIGTWQLLVRAVRVKSPLVMASLLWSECHITAIMLLPEHLEIHPSSFKQLSPSSPWPRWIHLTDGSAVRMSGAWSQILLRSTWILHRWRVVRCQSSQLMAHLRSKTDLANISASFGGESMRQGRWMGTWRNNLQRLNISVLNHLGRNPYLFWSMVWLGLRVDIRFLLASSHCQCMSHTIWCNPSRQLPFLASRLTFYLGIGIGSLLHDFCAGRLK